MKSLLSHIITIPSLLLGISCAGQIKNVKTVTVKIDGNCEMCEKTIENAGNQKKAAMLDWNKDTKQATISYDDTKTKPDDILKRIALAGYDNEKYLAPDEAYDALPGCCQYDRNRKKTKIKDSVTSNSSTTKTESTNTKQNASTNQFKNLLDSYFELKNALVNTDNKTASQKATNLSDAIAKVEMNKLGTKQHDVWMKLYKDLTAKSDAIAKSKSIEDQRKHFMALSENMYELAKIAKLEKPIYYQNCPMYNDGKGANWLSLENAVKNPYYGSTMMSCGKTIETIK